MDVDVTTVGCVYDSIYGGWLGTLITIDGNEPPHTAVRAGSQSHVAVERDLCVYVHDIVICLSSILIKYDVHVILAKN